ncbi:MAG: hypothetical protein JOZ68_06075 [Acidimicrobiia bacterium]|nr:hypothetical protein [Acidimicrobiia bacterium]MBV9040549.1 hypothetical protein [Acidimicrobiia bacterium]
MPPVLHRQAEAGRHRRPGRALRASLRRSQGEQEVADAGRAEALRQAKLRALVRGQWGEGDRRPERFPGGAALVGADTAWVYAAEEPARALGRGLLWAHRLPIAQLHLIVDDASGALARRAAAFAAAPTVWRVDDTSLIQAEPEQLGTEPALDPRLELLADVIRRSGAEPVVEHGVLRGEVLGLEVARAAIDEHGPVLEVGVGKHDRQAQGMVHVDEPTEAALARVVATVEGHRRGGAPHHPYNRLAPERWLRARAVANPALVGAAELTPIPSPVEVDDLRKSAPAPAAGVDVDGRPLVAVFSTGVDVDLVPAAVDARLSDGRGARLVIVVPERDDHPYLRPLADALIEPAEVMTVPDDWRSP